MCPPKVPQPLTILHVLQEQATRCSDALALLAPERAPLSYSALARHVEAVGCALQATGIRQNERVAVVLPNGPEMAVAFLAVASGTTCTPLNPAYSADEFAAHLDALHAVAVLVQAEVDSPVRAVAEARGLRMIELAPLREAAAGIFTLTGLELRAPRHQREALPDDVAVVLPTAGTTSRPKLVPVTHANICASAYNTCLALDLMASDRCLNVLPLFHTYGPIGTILASLVAGASVVCAPGFAVPTFFACLDAFRPTWYPAVPTMHQAIVDHAEQYRQIIARCPLRFIRSGSAPLPAPVRQALEQVFQAPVLETYGMTETSVITCNPPPRRSRKPGSVGMAAGPEVAIMDAGGTVLPAGEIGEIVVRGASVMSGYVNDPVANNKAFMHGWFRTGDQGFVDTDGYVFLTGRLSELINRGGEKIAPWEVDTVLMEHPAVTQAMTFAVPHARVGEDVAAAIVLRPGATVAASHLRAFAAMRLAAFKVPQQIFLVETLPTGATGKLQRRELATYFGQTGLASGSLPDPRGPHTPLEELLTGLWEQVCGVARVGIHDNFFQLGGDSLLATQLLSRLREATHVEVPFSRFFAMPTVAEIAAEIEATHRTTSATQLASLRPVPRGESLPLSYAQQRLWLLAQLGQSRQAYHLLDALRLRGPLQVAALAQSLQEMTRRHEVFRTTFVQSAGRPVQIIGPPPIVPLPLVDLQSFSADEQEARLHAVAQAEIHRPFDLEQGPVLRATLIRLAETEYVLLLIMHHIVFDGWSHRVFWREFAMLYGAFAAGQPASLPALSYQYADFAYWQHQWLQGTVLDTLLAYWQHQLAGMSSLHLPTDHPRPGVQTFRGARYFLSLPLRLMSALKTLSQRAGVTLFMTLLAAFQTLLHRYTGQDDIAVGSLIANRNRVELEGMIGFFVNTLVLRTNLSGDPRFWDLLARVRAVALGAYEHQDLPYEKLLEVLRPPRDMSRNPLFQVLFVLHNTLQQTPELPGLLVSSLEIDPGTARFDVALEFWETPQGLLGRCEYSTDLFEAATIARMAEHMQTLLEGIVSEPEQRLSLLPLLTVAARQRLLVEWNATSRPYPADQCLHHLFEAQVTYTPDAMALVCAGTSLTYRELNRRANQVAHYLRDRGVGPEKLVGLCLERSLAMVVGLLGILKAGAAYLPLDPTYPAERLAFMLDDAQPAVVLTQERLVSALPCQRTQTICLDTHWPTIAQARDDNPYSGATADHLASVLYTSGSTGQPKGVLGSHRATLNVLAWLWHTYPFAHHEVCCQKTHISFVDALQELFAPLLQGIQTVLIPDDTLQEPTRFVQTLAMHRVTRVILVPSLLRVLLETSRNLQKQLPHLQLWFAGGEALASDLVRRFQECLPHSRLVNLYGASETSANTTWYDTSLAPCDGVYVPIGRPIANTQVYVLDTYRQPVPIGVSGELYVGGAGLTFGYLNRPALTAERFISHPFHDAPGARLYKTGDLVRYRPDGNLEYLGRFDYQVKLRGIRIEPGEIEAVLIQHPAVREAVVIACADDLPETRLVAYVVPAHAAEPSTRELRSFLALQLPASMVPTVFVMLWSLPLTPSGKVDRQALPVPGPGIPTLTEGYVAPRTLIEHQVAVIWCRVLGLEQLGMDDNFFELGGHSLLAMQLLSRVRDTFQVEVPLRRFFERPTVAGMAAMLANTAETEQDMHALPLVPVPRDGPLLASIAQEPFWHVAQIFPSLPLFNIPYVVRLVGTLDVTLLEQSFQEIIHRHEVLRTTFVSVEGQLRQIIAPTMLMPLTMHDLRVLPQAHREGEAQRLLQDDSQRPFDLIQGPLLRGCLLRLDEQEHHLLVTLHHIICDGWSLGVLRRELATVYEAFAVGKPSPLPALPIQYADFTAWQRQWRQDGVLTGQLAYWTEQFRRPVPALGLPTDAPRGTGFHVHTTRQPFVLPKALCALLTPLGQEEHSTLFMTCLTALHILLYGYTGQEDLCVATLMANRTRQETEGLIGLLVNTVLLRTHLGGNPTGREILRRVRTTTLAAYTHQDVPFEELLRVLEGEHRMERTALCQVLVIWQNAMLWPLQHSAHTLSFQTLEQSVVPPAVSLTTFDVILILRERPQGLSGTCIYKTDLFEAATISRMLDDFHYVLTCLGTEPEQRLETYGSLQGSGMSHIPRLGVS